MAGHSNKLPVLAVYRVENPVTLAIRRQDDPSEQIVKRANDVFDKLLVAASIKLSAGQRTRLKWNEGSVCCLMDSNKKILYCVVTESLAYPEKLAYQLLYDLMAVVTKVDGKDGCDVSTLQKNGLDSKLMGEMRELMKRYENPSDKEFGVNHANYSDTFASEEDSDHHENKEKKAPWQMWMIIIGIVVLVVIAFAVYWFGFRGTADNMQVAFGRDATRAALARVPGVSPSVATITMV